MVPLDRFLRSICVVSSRLLSLFFALSAVLVSPLSVATASSPGELRLTLSMQDPANVRTGSETAGHCRAAVVTAVTLSPDGQSVAAAGDDHCLRLWDTRTGERRHTLRGHKDWIRAVRFSPDGQRLASAGNDSTLRLWTFQQPEARSRRIQLSGGPLQSVAFHPTEPSLATVGFGNILRMHDATTGEEQAQLACPCRDTRTVVFSGSGRWVAVAGRNGVVRLWDLAAKKEAIDLKGDGRRVRAMAFAPGGNLLATAGDGPAVRLWRLESQGESISPSFRSARIVPMVEEILTRPGKNYALAFLTDHVLAVGGTSNSIRLYDVGTASPRGELTGHTGTVAALAASADGRMLVSGSFDTTVRVWSLGESIAGEDRVAVRNKTEKTGAAR